MSLVRTLADMRRQAAHRIGRRSTSAADAIDVDALADDIRHDAITSGHVRFSGEGASRSGETTLDEVVAEWVAETAAAAT